MVSASFLLLVAGSPPTAYAAGRLLGRFCRRRRTDAATLGSLSLAGMLGAGFLGYALFSAALTATPAEPTLAGRAALALLACVPAVAFYLGSLPALAAARGVEVEPPDAALAAARYAAGFALAVAVLFTGVERFALGGSAVAGALAVLVLVTVAALAAPYLSMASSSTRAPTRAERRRLDRLREDAGLSVRRIRVVDGDRFELACVECSGLAPNRFLFVSDVALDRFDDDVLRALLTARAGQYAARHAETLLFGLTLLVCALVAAIAGALPLGRTVLAAAVGVPAIFALARRRRLAADDWAAERAGRETVADAFERIARVNGVDPDGSSRLAWFRAAPPLGVRIARLRARG